MIVQDLMNIDGIQNINKVKSYDRAVENVYIGDLLSWVMGHIDENSIWITVQNHLNVVAIAHLHDLPAIIFVEGAFPLEETIDKANESDIPLFVYDGTAYELAVELYKFDI
ncbi:MAG: hypothetical protein U0L85_08645 [Bacilli bacterium]|nr:hypothetical protein [Bacilli bacterium]